LVAAGDATLIADMTLIPDMWSRWLRKLLSDILAVLLCQQAGLGSHRFADLITS
jgi:hypothetical protein